MNDGRLAYDPNRLPWLPNEQRPPPPTPQPRRRRPRRESRIPWALLVPWALLGLLLIAGVSYWLGMRSAREETSFEPPAQVTAPEASITLPEARQPEPLPAEPVEVAPVIEAPVVAPAPAPPLPTAEKPRPAPKVPAPTRAKPKRQVEAREAPDRDEAEEKPRTLQPWPSTVVEGASGRLVRIGTFRSPREAKRAWWAVMRTYPGMQRLKAVVVPAQSLRNNQTYYRLQFGTTSQAHSAVLCQRMRMIGQSCVVIGVQSGGERQAND